VGQAEIDVGADLHGGHRLGQHLPLLWWQSRPARRDRPGLEGMNHEEQADGFGPVPSDSDPESAGFARQTADVLGGGHRIPYLVTLSRGKEQAMLHDGNNGLILHCNVL
jgi:hypothetical protein